MRLMFFIFLATLLVGCSNGGKKPNAVFRLDRAILAGPFNGMLYGRHVETGKKFAKKFTDASSSITIALLNGTWDFALIAWDGVNPYEGTVKCHSQQAVLNGEAKTIAANLTIADCANAIFGGTNSYEPTFGFKTVNFNNCSSIDHVTAFGDTCPKLQRGFNRSFKFALAEYNEFSGSTRSVAYDSTCVATVPADGATTTSLRLPIGDANPMFDLIVKAYDDFSCTGYEDASVVIKGLSDPEAKVYGDQAAITYVFFEDEGRDKITLLASTAVTPSGSQARPFFTLPTTPNATYVYQLDGNFTNQTYTSDLTFSGTSPIFPSPTYSSYSTLDMIKVGSIVYFAANADASTLYQFYSFNGFTTTLESSFTAGGSPPYGVQGKLHSLGNSVYFKIKDNTDVERLCEFNGSLTCNLEPTTSTNIQILGAHGSTLFFAATVGGNINLYARAGGSNTLALDLTAASVSTVSDLMYRETLGTYQYAFVQASPSSFLLQFSSAGVATILHNNIPYVNASEPPIKTSTDLWVIVNEGAQGSIPAQINTAGAITPLTTSFASATSTKLVGMLGTKLMFFSDDQNTSDVKLFAYDTLSPPSPVVVADHASSLSNSLSSTKIIGSKVYFVGNEAAEGQEPYIYNGTTASLLADINPGATGSSTDKFISFKNEVYFAADDGTNGQELWKTDGTSPGTAMVANVGSGASNAYPYAFSKTANYLYFVANDATFYRFYRTDGTSAGTVPLYNVQDDGFSTRVFSWDDRIHYHMADSSQIHQFFIK